MWRMLVGFLPLSLLFTKQNYFVSEWKSAFFSFSSFFFPRHLTKLSGKAEQGHEKQSPALELDTGTCPQPGSGHGGSAWGTSNQRHPPRPCLFPGAGQPQISP